MTFRESCSYPPVLKDSANIKVCVSGVGAGDSIIITGFFMGGKNDLPKVTWKPRVRNVEIFMRRSRILESESTRGPFTLKTEA